MNVFANVFPDEAAVFERATEFYQEKFDEVPLKTPTDVLFLFGSCLYWAKQELGYKDDPLTRIRRFRSFVSAGIPTYFVHFRPTRPC